MNFKKVFAIVAIYALLFGGVGAVIACEGNDCGTPGFGFLNISDGALSGAMDMDSARMFGGYTLGFSGVLGESHGEAGGFVMNGDVSGELNAGAGGVTLTDSYMFMNEIDGGWVIGLISTSNNYSITSGSLSLSVDPDKCGFGMANGHISGFTSQGSHDISGMTLPGIYKTDGTTSGEASQGSAGGFVGSAGVVSGPDLTYTTYERTWVPESYSGGEDGDAGWYQKQNGQNAGEIKYFKNGHPQPCGNNEWVFLGSNHENGHWESTPVEHTIDSSAGATVGASIIMTGGSFSESYRFWERNGGVYTEGLGTNVGSETHVTSSGYTSNTHNVLGGSWSLLSGGYMAGGNVESTTLQNDDFGVGYAHALGEYFGGGSLNTNYDGSALGGTVSQITTVAGMNGSIIHTTSRMAVSSSTSTAN